MFFADQPYAYAGNNPLVNVDPSGQRFAPDPEVGAPPAPTHRVAGLAAPRPATRVRAVRPAARHKAKACHGACAAKAIGDEASSFFGHVAALVLLVGAIIAAVAGALATEIGAAISADIAAAVPTFGLSLVALPELLAGEAAAVNLGAVAFQIAVFGGATAYVAWLFGEASGHEADSGYWTFDHLEAGRAKALGVMGGMIAFFRWIAGLVETVSTASSIIAKGAFGFYVGSVIGILGSAWIFSEVNDYSNREEAALNT
jgi:hypothetical protein